MDMFGHTHASRSKSSAKRQWRRGKYAAALLLAVSAWALGCGGSLPDENPITDVQTQALAPGGPIEIPEDGCVPRCTDRACGASDGCGGTCSNNGWCPTGLLCGLVKPNVCSGCPPTACLGKPCGADNGCGIPCSDGICARRYACGAGGTPNVCAPIHQGDRFWLKVMAWNLEIENADDSHIKIPDIASHVNHVSPDLLLVNEIRGYWARNSAGNGTVPASPDDTGLLADRTGLRHYRYNYTVNTGFTGSKGVAVLSRYPILRVKYHQAPTDGQLFSIPTYGTIEVVLKIYNVYHHVFSTRFDAHSDLANARSHDQAVSFIKSVDHRAPIFFGGDFNTEIVCDHHRNFRLLTGLLDTLQAARNGVYLPDADDYCTPARPEREHVLAGGRIDFLFYRGPYTTRKADDVAMHLYYPSDHPYVLAELSSPTTPNLFLTGGVTYTNEEADKIGVVVDRPTNVPADQVEFVFRTLPSITWAKQFEIQQSTGAVLGRLSTAGAIHEQRTAVPLGLLSKGAIVLRKDKGGGVIQKAIIRDPGTALGGSRIIFTWERD